MPGGLHFLSEAAGTLRRGRSTGVRTRALEPDSEAQLRLCRLPAVIDLCAADFSSVKRAC